MSQVQDTRSVVRIPADITAGGATNGQSNGDHKASLGERVRALRLAPVKSSARPRRTWLLLGFTLIAVATGGLFAWRAYRLSPGDGAAATDQAATSGSVQSASGGASATGATPAAAAPTAATGDVVLDSKGFIIAAHQIKLSPQVGGEIIWLDPNFKEGAVYKKGDKLAEVDPVIYAAQLDSANAALQVAQTNLQQVETGSTLNEIEAAKSQLKNLAAHLELSQIDARYLHAAGIAVTQHDKDKADAQVHVDQAAYEAQKDTLAKLETSLLEQRAVCKAQVLSAQANVQQAEKQLKNCTILAPTSGIILTKNAELGGYVNPFAFGAAGYLCEMADLKDLEVDLDIQERDFSRIKIGERCRIMPDAAQNDAEFAKTHPLSYSGVVSRRMPVADRGHGSIKVRVTIDIPEREPGGQYLLPEMGVLVSFLK